MVAMIVTLTPTQGSDEASESVLQPLAEDVRANEPGNKAYQLARCRGDDRSYKVWEVYQARAALDGAFHRITLRPLRRKWGR
jgi:quinol monooxygenase YgiN